MECQDQSNSVRFKHLRRSGVGHAGSDQRDPGETLCPLEFQVGNRETVGIIVNGLKSVPVRKNQNVNIGRVHVPKATVPHRFAAGAMTVSGLGPAAISHSITASLSASRSATVEDA